MKKKSVLMLYRKEFDVDPVPYRQSKALLERGFNVKIIAWDRTGLRTDREDMDEIEIHNVKVRCPYGKILPLLLKLPFYYWKVLLKLRDENFDILHCHDIHTLPVGFFISKLRGKSFLYDVHDFYLDVKWKFFGSLMQKLEKLLASNASYILVPSPPLGEHYKKLKEHVEVIFNAPEKHLFKPSDGSKKSKSDEFIIAHFGNVRWVKQLKDLMEATKDIEHVQIFIGGGGIKINEVRKIASKYKHVRVGGFVPYEELIRRYSQSDCIYAVYPSTNQAIKYSVPMKIFEAMACGLPVIANSEGYTGKFVRENRVGICVDEGNLSQIKEAVETLINDRRLREELGKNGRRLVEDFYNWENMRNYLLKVYENIIGEGRNKNER